LAPEWANLRVALIWEHGMSRGHSFDLRKRVIALVEGGMSRRAAARQLLVSESSSIKWFRRFKETGSFAEKPGKKSRPSPHAKTRNGVCDAGSVFRVLICRGSHQIVA
jgi:hypothetical protein